MIGVKDRGNPIDPPSRIIFTPDGLMKRQRGLKRCRVGKSQKITGNSSTKVVENNGEPRLSWLIMTSTLIILDICVQYLLEFYPLAQLTKNRVK